MSPPRPIAVPVRELALRLHDGRLASEAFYAALMARIEERNARDKAYITVAGAHVGERLDALAAGRRGGAPSPLHAVPYALKDMFETRGIATTGGSRVLEGWIPERDAAVVERLDAAGAVMVGKANLHEFAHGIIGENARFGTAPNPWDPTRIAGGSSSGSAVAVANGLASFGIGTDTGGSIRVPAALCGLVGLKPSYGRVSCHGMIPYCWSLDHVGIIAPRVADVAQVLKAVAGYDPRDPNAIDAPVPDYVAALAGSVRGLRIGVPDDAYLAGTDPAILAAMRRSLTILGESGAALRPVAMPDMSMARTVSLLVQMPEALSYHRRYLPEKMALYATDVRAGLAFGQFILAEHYVRAKRMVERYRRQMDALLAEVDAIVTPSSAVVAPEIGAATVEAGGVRQPVGNALTRFTGFFNMTGNPAISLPSGRHPSGLPMGVQIIGRPFEEATVLRLAECLAEAQEWLFGEATEGKA